MSDAATGKGQRTTLTVKNVTIHRREMSINSPSVKLSEKAPPASKAQPATGAQRPRSSE